MVDTMALLHPFSRTARTSRTVPPRPVAPASPGEASGLPADDEVLLDAPDDRLGAALVAAARGEYRPASALLAAPCTLARWEYRDRYTRRLAAFARSRDEWRTAWSAADPRDPDALLVAGQLAVDRAWDSPARSELLREVSPLITAAARGDDRDPVPWRLALDHAHGTDAGHKYFSELWEAALRRAPHHYGCHAAALRYLAASWRHSHLECFYFADRAAQDAPLDSLIQALPSRAAFAYLTDDCGAQVPHERLEAAADLAIALSARFPAADPWPSEIRNKLTYVLVRLERWQEALDQLRLIGPYATSFPWVHLSDDPLAFFLSVRAEVRVRAAEQASVQPRTGRVERTPSRDH